MLALQSATHGVEGFAGSACILDLLGSGDEVLLVVRREGDARVARRVSSPASSSTSPRTRLPSAGRQ